MRDRRQRAITVRSSAPAGLNTYALAVVWRRGRTPMAPPHGCTASNTAPGIMMRMSGAGWPLRRGGQIQNNRR